MPVLRTFWVAFSCTNGIGTTYLWDFSRTLLIAKIGSMLSLNSA